MPLNSGWRAGAKTKKGETKMSALTNVSKKFCVRPRGNTGFKAFAESHSEAIWFTVSFLLFLALGPFAAIPAFLAVMSLASGEGEEPESL